MQVEGELYYNRVAGWRSCLAFWPTDLSMTSKKESLKSVNNQLKIFKKKWWYFYRRPRIFLVIFIIFSLLFCLAKKGLRTSIV